MGKRRKIFALLILLVAVVSCQEKNGIGKKKLDEPNWDSALVQRRVIHIENIFAKMASTISKDEQKLIKKYGLAYLQTEFDWEKFSNENENVPLNQAFASLGVYSIDDRRQMLRENLLLYLKGEKLVVGEMAIKSRSRWEEVDGVLPPVRINCPLCGQIMKLNSMGNGYDKNHPEAWVFTGECPQGHYSLYDQQSGWRLEKK